MTNLERFHIIVSVVVNTPDDELQADDHADAVCDEIKAAVGQLADMGHNGMHEGSVQIEDFRSETL